MPAFLPDPLRGMLSGSLLPPKATSAPEGQQVSDPAAGVIQTIAGGSSDGQHALHSTFFTPTDGILAPDGSLVVVDLMNQRVRRVDRATGLVGTIAGTGDIGHRGDGGPAAEASMGYPLQAAFAPDGDLYITEYGASVIRRIDASSGVIATAGGTVGCGEATDGVPALESPLCGPAGIAVDDAGNLLFADAGNCTVRMIAADTGMITKLAGNGSCSSSGDGGPATDAGIAQPWALTLDGLGNPIVSESVDGSPPHIRYINRSSQPVTIYPSGNVPLVVQPGTIQTIAGTAPEPGGGAPSTLPDGRLGDGDPATLAPLEWVADLDLGPNGDLYLTQPYGQVRRIDWRSGVIQTIAGIEVPALGTDGVKARQSALYLPVASFSYPNGDVGIVEEGTGNVRRVDATTNLISRIAGSDFGDGLPPAAGVVQRPHSVVAGPTGTYFSENETSRVRGWDPPAGAVSTAIGASRCHVQLRIEFGCSRDEPYGGWLGDMSPDGLVVFVTGNSLQAINTTEQPVTVYPESNHPIVIPPGSTSTIAGGGSTWVSFGQRLPAREASIDPWDVAVAPNGNLYFTETAGHWWLNAKTGCRVTQIDGRTGVLSVLAGQDRCLGLTAEGGSELNNYLDGPLQTAQFFHPEGIAVGKDGAIYVADTGNSVIRRIDLELGLVTTYAGTPCVGRNFVPFGGCAAQDTLAYPDFFGDGGPRQNARFYLPQGISVAPDGSLIVADTGNHRIRRIAPDGIVTTLAGSGGGATDTACGYVLPAEPCSRFSGDGGPATEAHLFSPEDAFVTADGTLLIADTMNFRIRAVQTTLVAQPSTARIAKRLDTAGPTRSKGGPG
jgi:sugar lactone lactonase YvrE